MRQSDHNYKEIFKFISDLPDSSYVMSYITENKYMVEA